MSGIHSFCACHTQPHKRNGTAACERVLVPVRNGNGHQAIPILKIQRIGVVIQGDCGHHDEGVGRCCWRDMGFSSFLRGLWVNNRMGKL